MKYIIRIVLVFFLFSMVFADKMEIKVGGKGIYLPSLSPEKEYYGAVLVINGGPQAQSPELLQYLANQLAQNGWFIVFLKADKSSSVLWRSQLPEVIKTLRQQKAKRLVILHYGEQLKETLLYLTSPPVPEVEGLILLSAYDTPPAMVKQLKLNMPVFDIIGQFDFDSVKQAMTLRQKEFKVNKSNYLSIEIPGVQHDYMNSQQLLFSFIYGWMMKLPEFQPQPKFMYS